MDKPVTGSPPTGLTLVTKYRATPDGRQVTAYRKGQTRWLRVETPDRVEWLPDEGATAPKPLGKPAGDVAAKEFEAGEALFDPRPYGRGR